MNYVVVALVIFLTALLAFFVPAIVTSRPGPVPADQWPEGTDHCHEAHPGHSCSGQPLPRAGRFEVEYLPGPPFAGATGRGADFDTGPLIIMSEFMASCADLDEWARRYPG